MVYTYFIRRNCCREGRSALQIVPPLFTDNREKYFSFIANGIDHTKYKSGNLLSAARSLQPVFQQVQECTGINEIKPQSFPQPVNK